MTFTNDVATDNSNNVIQIPVGIWLINWNANYTGNGIATTATYNTVTLYNTTTPGALGPTYTGYTPAVSLCPITIAGSYVFTQAISTPQNLSIRTTVTFVTNYPASHQ